MVLESTTYPGTTRDVAAARARGGRARGRAATSSWPSAPSARTRATRITRPATIPKVVGGLDAASRELAAALYGRRSCRRSCRSRSCEVAEACKILENTYRAVNIALVNELKVLFDRMGIDVWEVIEAAKTKPFGFQAFYPGPGPGRALHPDRPVLSDLGGPQLRPARRASSSWPARSTRRCRTTSSTGWSAALNDRGKPVKGSRVLRPGHGLQEGRGRLRESPASS